MKTLRPALLSLLVAAACASIAACADNPPRRADPDYRSRPAPAAQRANGATDAPDQRLTIQSGQGEKLNVPWFVRDAQDQINSK